MFSPFLWLTAFINFFVEEIKIICQPSFKNLLGHKIYSFISKYMNISKNKIFMRKLKQKHFLVFSLKMYYFFLCSMRPSDKKNKDKDKETTENNQK